MTHKKLGNRPAVRGHRKARSPQHGIIEAAYTIAAAVDGNTSALDVTFSAPVTPSSANPLNALAIVATAAGGTTRAATVITRTGGNTFRLTMAGALTAAKTYAVAIATGYGSFVDSQGNEVIGTQNAITPA